MIAFREIRRFQPRQTGSFRAWLSRIAERRLFDAIKAERASRPKIRRGENVVVENDNEYRAGCDGRMRWEKEILSVDSVYVISGNVDLETGYIRHSGSVLVMGDKVPGLWIEIFLCQNCAFGTNDEHGDYNLGELLSKVEGRQQREATNDDGA